MALQPEVVDLAPYWAWFAIPLLIEIQISADEFLMPSERLGIFHQLVFQMIFHDVVPFVCIFIIFLLNFGVAMYITMPPYGIGSDELNVDGNWNIISAAYDITALSFFGDSLDNLDVRAVFPSWNGTNWVEGDLVYKWDHFNFIIFFVLYVMYALISITLLLNLLIAMMGDTYSTSAALSTIQYRVGLARRVMFYEQIFVALNNTGLVKFDLHCGERGTTPEGKTYHFVQFQSVEPNKEGYGQGSQKPIFDPADAFNDADDEVMNGQFFIEETAADQTKVVASPPPPGQDVNAANELVAKLQRMIDQMQSMVAVPGSREATNARAAIQTAMASNGGHINAARGGGHEVDRTPRYGSETNKGPGLGRSSSLPRTRAGLHSGLRKAPSFPSSP